MIIAIAAIMLAAMPSSGPVIDCADLVEVNHYCSEINGEEIWCQVIFYEWLPPERRYAVRAWRFLPLVGRPEKDWRRGCWINRWTEYKLEREVRSSLFRESWTLYDIEKYERDQFPGRERHKLTMDVIH